MNVAALLVRLSSACCDDTSPLTTYAFIGALAAAIVSAICVLGFIPPVVEIVGAVAPTTLGAGILGAAPTLPPLLPPLTPPCAAAWLIC